MGGSYVLNSRGDEVGVFGHYTKQVSDDKGTEGSFLSDQTAGIGGFVSYWIVPKKIGAMARITQSNYINIMDLHKSKKITFAIPTCAN
jgi:hypothetical protein